MSVSKPDWRRVAVFMLLATALSSVARFDIASLSSQLPTFGTQLAPLLLMALLEGVGIALAAWWGSRMLAKQQQLPYSLLGAEPVLALSMVALTLGLIVGFGVANPYGVEPRLYGALAAGTTLLYCLMEELGWRGYLQTELSALANGSKYALIGTAWYLWHLSFLTGASWQANLLFWGAMIGGSWGIGQVMRSTQSIMVCACFHLCFQIVAFNALFKGGFVLGHVGWFAAICFSGLVMLVKQWERRQPQLKAGTERP